MKMYYTYVLDDRFIVYQMYENLSDSDKKRIDATKPFGFWLIEHNKPLPIGSQFPIHRQEVVVKNICNIVVIGDDINVRI